MRQQTATSSFLYWSGALSTLDLTSGANAPTLTASEGVVLIDDIYLNKKWFKASDDECGAYGLVYFKLTPATLNAARTNEST